MLEVLQFIFSSFWIWLGSVCLILVLDVSGKRDAVTFAVQRTSQRHAYRKHRAR
jgi:hypothetical protein